MNIIEIFEKTPDLLRDREKVKALFCDSLDKRSKSNLMMMAYDEGILDVMKKSYPMSEKMQHNFVKRLCRNFCIPEDKAEYSVRVWMKIVSPDVAQHLDFHMNTKAENDKENKKIFSDKIEKVTLDNPRKKRAEWIEEYEEAIVIFCGKKEYGAFNNDGIVLNWLINCRLGVKGKDTFATFPNLSFIEEVLISRHVNYIVIEDEKKIKERLYSDNHYPIYLSKAVNSSENEEENIKQKPDLQSEKTDGETEREEKNGQVECLSPKDRAIFEARQRVAKGEGNLPVKTKPLHECKDCMLYRNETCFGRNHTCEDFRFAPTIPKEEMDFWPKMGDASFYRLGGRYRH